MSHRTAQINDSQSDSDGIDYAHYAHQARRLRAQAFADVLRFIRLSARIAARPRDDAGQLKVSRARPQALDEQLPAG